MNTPTSIYSIPVTSINGTTTTLEPYKGKTLLIVNVASKCGFTKQYTGLEELYKKHQEQGLVVLGFPCNQFGNQEPGNEEEIAKFCDLNFGVTFPLFAKINVNGEDTHPLYAFLKQQAKGILGTEAVKWNFTKFLVDNQGNVVTRFASTTTPEEIEKDIVKIL